jgi:IS1 family transposase
LAASRRLRPSLAGWLCREQNTAFGDQERGDFFTYLSVDRATKLIINWRTGKRTRQTTLEFMQDLRARVPECFQLTTDGFTHYCGLGGTVREVFKDAVDYATETKFFGKDRPFFPKRFNPKKVIAVKKRVRLGSPDMKLATTCHAERTNLSVRTFTRRFTRLTLGYSKKVENLRHAVALFVAHFNFCREHGTLKQTPAMAAGLTDKTWTIGELIGAETSTI